jgi:5'-nucleotidase/UDP-sugar diphosphatase
MYNYWAMERSKLTLISLVFFCSTVAFTYAKADTKITVLHTSDIHGHFTDKDSPIRLGGVARLKTKIDTLRKKNGNNLLLDSGDWTEGTIFYTLNSGEANHKLMEAFGYDAIVLGNHEWLVGPKELYHGLAEAQFTVPILSANINLERLPPEIPLGKYLKPYIIKEIGGKKIGILGLSTFDMIYDPFFEPGEITEPTQLALKYVRQLKQVDKCDAVIVLSHLGIDRDKKIAESVPGIDLILGGHTHVMTKKPIYVNGVPIVHIGIWGQFLGEYELNIKDNGKTEFTDHKIHQIDHTLPENPYIQDLVNGFQKRIETIRGNIFNDKIFSSQVNLPLGTTITDDVLGNWAMDAVREAGKTQTSFSVGDFYARSIFAGTSSTIDFFNMFPHVWNHERNKAWTIFNLEVKGENLQQLINLIVKTGAGVKVSNASYQIDGKQSYFVVKNFKIGNESMNSNKFYKISATEGILHVFDFLKKAGTDVGIRNVKDTGIEAWSAIKDYVVAKSPMTPEKAQWQGRVRTLQPDIYIPLEQVVVTKKDPTTVVINYKLINAGMQPVVMPTTQAKIDLTPLNTLDEKWLTAQEINQNQDLILKPGQMVEKSVTFTQSAWIPGYYPVEIEASVNDKEFNKVNNKVVGYYILE